MTNQGAATWLTAIALLLCVLFVSTSQAALPLQGGKDKGRTEQQIQLELRLLPPGSCSCTALSSSSNAFSAVAR